MGKCFNWLLFNFLPNINRTFKQNGSAQVFLGGQLEYLKWKMDWTLHIFILFTKESSFLTLDLRILTQLKDM